MNAKDMVFTTLDMEIMFKENQRAYKHYEENCDTTPNMIIVEKFHSLDQFIESRMKALAEVSHGDVVLIEGKELKRVKGNYKQEKKYKAKD